MNHVYRVVFNHALKCVQVVSEFARSRSTVSSSAARRAPALAALSTAIALGCFAPGAFAADANWNEWRGTIDNDWGTPGNWQMGEPRANDPLARATYIDSNRTAVVTATGEGTNHIHVGDTGIGTLRIESGGQLTSATIFMGTGEVLGTRGTADGRAVITGAGSTWTALGTIGVGHWGKGLVDIDQGGKLAIGTDSYIASGLGAVGVVNVSGSTSSFTTGGTLLLGAGGNGTVNVTDGATATAQFSRIGVNAGSVGLMNVSDGGVWQTRSALYVGQGGTGTARLSSGATATVASGLYVGTASTGNGTVDISGNGSSMDVGVHQMLIGDLGTAKVTVSDGARLSGGETWMGNRVGGNGSITVTGNGSLFETLSLKVGTNGIGSFTVEDGAVATVSGSVDFAMTSTSQGSIKVGQGATLAVGNAMTASITAGSGQASFELAGGILRSDATLSLDTQVALSTDSTLEAQYDVYAMRAFSGNGRLTKTGVSTLSLFDVDRSDWSGGLQVNEGSLLVAGNKALGTGWLGMADGTTLALVDGVTVSNSVQLLGNVELSVVGDRSATLSSASGSSGTVLTKTGEGTLTLGGGTVGATRVEEGTLRVTGNALNGGNIEIGSAGTFEIDTTRVLTYAGQISGSGFLRQGRHSLTLSGDSSAFTGTTVINGGQLNVTGSLGGDVQVTRGGWLTGNGSLGNVFVSGFSTLSPGTTTAAISRLDIAGVLNFDDSSTFQVDLAANGASDFVSVGGSTLLGQANTVAVAADGDWAPSTRYHLLTAAGGVNGTFSGVTSNLAFLDPTLSYDANNVYLTMARNDVSMPDVQLTFPEVVVNTNQQAVAGAVEALGEGNAVYDAVVRLEVPQVVPAFDSLSGEVHAAHRGTLLQNRFLHDGIDRHLDGRAISGEISPGLRVWLAGSGGQQRTDATANSTATRVSQDGLMAGAGWQVGEALELGVAAGQQRLETRLRSGTGQAETDSTEYGVYAAYQWQGLRLRGGVTRADYRTDSTRDAQVGSTLSETLVARENATGTTAFVRAGWTFGASRLQLTPEIELAQVRLESDGSQERGGDSALVIGAADSDYRTGVAALKADWDISGGQRDRAVLTARVGWQYADGDRLPVADARFVAGTRDFSIAGTPLARSTALAQLGVAISPSANSRVSLQVQGRRGGDQRELGAQLDWSVGF
ncbi:autotransporter domain-containing protein [Stenotrophomonas sp. PS02289]|uniref:autotransporter domain-containing protein n=1 Tax=Stenotrophomonas sp. PS02289 TaxID=2991422 RepID=UPI00249B2250|nr:autotransporter domain-containing protein [Stenotrophomonas sp. PS02289]